MAHVNDRARSRRRLALAFALSMALHGVLLVAVGGIDRDVAEDSTADDRDADESLSIFVGFDDAPRGDGASAAEVELPIDSASLDDSKSQKPDEPVYEDELAPPESSSASDNDSAQESDEAGDGDLDRPEVSPRPEPPIESDPGASTAAFSDVELPMPPSPSAADVQDAGESESEVDIPARHERDVVHRLGDDGPRIERDGTAAEIREVIRPTPDGAIEPEYPRYARRRGLEGIVTVRAEINSSGEVTAATVTGASGRTVLDDAALVAVQRSSFTPGTVDGTKRPMSIDIRVVFELAPGDS